jgi:hypothetical protein
MRQQPLRDVGVVLQQVALGDPELLPERLPEIRETNLPRAELQHDFIRVGWDDDLLRSHH